MAKPDDDLKDEVAHANASAGQPLLDRGRTLYEAGDLLGAVALWEEALEFDPDLALAREYIDYVQQNYDALVAEFTSGPDGAAAADAGITADGEDREGGRADALPPPPTGDNLEDGLAAVDAGLDRALDSPYGGVEEVGNEILLEDRSGLPTQPPRGDAFDDYQVLVGEDDDDDHHDRDNDD